MILMLKFDVPPYNLHRYFIPNRTYKVASTPPLSTSKLLLQLRMTSEKFLSRYALQYLDHPRWTVLRGTRQKRMDVIAHYFTGFYLHFITLHNRTLENQFAIHRNSNKVIFEIVNRVFGRFDRTHMLYSNCIIRLRRISSFLPTASCGVSRGDPL